MKNARTLLIFIISISVSLQVVSANIKFDESHA